MSDPTRADLSRYERQMALAEIGPDGQRRLAQSAVLVIGCGALGSTLTTLLVRAGVGRVRVVDRDRPELKNLHRQTLFDERDVANQTPKVHAAHGRLSQANSTVTIEPRVADVAPHNILSLLDGMDLVLDGTDNVETRYLINDACLERNIPWIYGGAVGTGGMTMSIRPGRGGPCLRCVFPEMPPAGALPTCETRGILNTVPTLIAALQVTEAFKLLLGDDRASTGLTVVDPWSGQWQTVPIAQGGDCPACVDGRRDFLKGKK